MDKKRKKKSLMLSVAMAVLMLLPLTMNAQYAEDKYGIQPWFGTSLLGRESGNVDGGDLTNQGFGSTQSGITNQTFNAPLGSGLLIMFAAGAGYATLKKRKSNR